MTPTEIPSLKQLTAHQCRQGHLVWIGLRPARRASMSAVQTVQANSSGGLEGDHYAGLSNKRRQVTLLQYEHLEVLSSLTGRAVQPEWLRRNLVVAGINLLSLKGQMVAVGPAILRITGHCHPCSRMEEILGKGGYNAMREHGGMTAEIVRSGLMTIGDSVLPIQQDMFGCDGDQDSC